MTEHLFIILTASFVHVFHAHLFVPLFHEIAGSLPAVLVAASAGSFLAAIGVPMRIHRYTRVSLLRLSFLAGGVIYGMQAFMVARNWTGPPFLLLCVLSGVCTAFIPIAAACVNDLKDSHRFVKRMTKMNLNRSLAKMLGPAIGALFFTTRSLSSVYALAAALSLLCFVFFTRYLDAKSRIVFRIEHRPKMHYTFHSLFIHVVAFVFYMSHGTFESFFAAHLKSRFGLDVYRASLALVLSVLCSACAAIFVCPWVIKRCGVNATLVIGHAVTGAAFVCMGRASWWRACHVAIMAGAAGAALITSAINNILIRITPSHQCASVMALDNALYAAARTAAPLVIGHVYRNDFRGASECFQIAGALVFLNIGVLFITRKERTVVTNLEY